MLPTRFTKLTTRQRECLRLYHRRFRVKEIAHDLGISENTVSGYLTEAAAILDVGGRRAAAAALAAFEEDHPDAEGASSPGHQDPAATGPVPRSAADVSMISSRPSAPLGVTAVDDMAISPTVTDAPSPTSPPLPPRGDHPYPRGRSQVGDPAAPLPQDDGHRRNSAVRPKHDPRTGLPRQAWVPLRQGGGNDLTVTRRFVWLGVITFLLVSGFGIFAFFIRTISDLAGGLAG